MFGYKRWDIVGPLTTASPSPLKELSSGQSTTIDGVQVLKQVWGEVPVFIFTPEGKYTFAIFLYLPCILNII